MLRTASIRLEVTPEQGAPLIALRPEYARACNLLVPIVREHRVWHRRALRQRSCNFLRESTSLGSQMACTAICTACKAYRALRARGHIVDGSPVAEAHFTRASVHFD